ncbi:MAG: hypothetical protein WBN22_00925, partial [Verrucomicrobiia bacterium]
PVSRLPSNNALIGIQNTREARTYSERGQQSMKTITHAAPVSRPAMSSGSSGGDGHGSNQQRH